MRRFLVHLLQGPQETGLPEDSVHSVSAVGLLWQYTSHASITLEGIWPRSFLTLSIPFNSASTQHGRLEQAAVVAEHN